MSGFPSWWSGFDDTTYSWAVESLGDQVVYFHQVVQEGQVHAAYLVQGQEAGLWLT